MNQKKHLKYDKNWVKEIPNLVPATEKVKDAQGQETDQNTSQRLLSQHTKLAQEIKQLETDISKTSNLKTALRYLDSRIKLWSDSSTASTYQGYSNQFHNTGSTNYNWEGKLKNWYQTSSGTYKDNLYKVNIGGNEYEITEEEVLNLMARVVHALEKVDLTDFTAKYTSAGGTNANLNTWLTNLKNEASLIKVGSGKDKDGKTGNRKSYDFPETYPQKHDNHVKHTNSPVYDNFFELVKEVKAHESFLTNLDANLQKDIPQTEKYQIFLKGDKWDSTKLKEDFGIEIASGQTFYKTGLQKVEFEVKGGLKGWIALADTIVNNDNQAKITYFYDAHRNNRPNLNLFNDMLDSVNTSTANFEGIGLGTQNTFQKNGVLMGLDKLPDSLTAYEQAYTDLETEYDANKILHASWLKEVKEKKDKQKEIEQEIDKLIAARVAELRTQLVQFKIKDGFEITYKADGKTVDKDNRRTALDILQIKHLLEDIRYLENADDTLLSSNADENTAYDKVAGIVDKKYSSLIYYLITDKGTNQEKIDKAKKDPFRGTDYLKRCLDELNRIEKLVKLTEVELQLKKDIETAMGKKDNAETLKTYTDILKTFDNNLETGFTETLKTKWQSDEAKNFQNSSSLKTLLESVKKDDNDSQRSKYEAFFNHIKGGTNGYQDVKDLDTWGKLLLKDPKVVITTIKRYEYDHLDNSGEDKDKKKTQRERNIKLTLNKKGTDALTDAEINTALYEDAIGKKAISAKSLKADLTEYEESQGSKKNTETSTLKDWFGFGSLGKSLFSYGLITAVVGGGIAAWAFWDRIKNWWEPKEEGEPESENE